jgi:hypothetical protein
MLALESILRRVWNSGSKRACFTTLLIVVAAAIPVCAQTDTGAIVGIVQDKSNARVAGASVDVTDDATGITRAYATNGGGEYQALQLIPGVYSVSVKHAGFGNSIRKGVTVNVQDRVQVDFVLTVSGEQQQIVVTETTAELQTQSAEVAGVMPSQELNDLPLNGRDYDTLVLTQPGIFRDNSVSNPAEGLFSANGNLQLQNYFQLDGIDNNSKSENLQEQSTQSVIPPPDALQEFVLQTRTYSAEFGTAAGAVVNVSTKSGTNKFHGDAWDYIQNGALNANTWLNNHGNLPRGQYNYNQFGGTLGGPIKRDKAFFFVSYENLISHTDMTETATVPTAAMQGGDFSVASNGSVMSKYNMVPTVPSQAGCITGNVISPGCLDSVGKKLIALYPAPNFGPVSIFPGSTGNSNSFNYEFVGQVPNNTRTLDARFDYTLNKTNQIFGRYALDWANYQTPPPWTSNAVAGNGAGFPTQYILHDQSVALGWTDSMRQNLVNTVHFGFLRTYSHSNPIGVQVGTSQAMSLLGLQGVPQNPWVFGIPPFQESGFTSIGGSYYRPQYQVAQTYQLLEALYWTKGQHSLQFGYEYHQDALNFFDIQSPQGIIYNSGIYTSTNGFSGGDILLGNVSQLILTAPTEINNYIRGNSFYAQDTWRATNNLTVNYGVRYELYPPFWLNREGRTGNFSCGAQAYPTCIASGPPANGGTMLTTGSGWSGQTHMVTDMDDFAPRVGISYHLFNPLVVRAGYGVFHQFINRIGSESMLQQNPPYLGSWQVAQTAGSTTPVFEMDSATGENSSAYLSSASIADLLKPGPTVTCATGTLVGGVCVGGVAGGLPTQHVRAQGASNRTSYVEQTSFGIQYQLSRNTIASANYIGNWGRKMNRVQNANQGFVQSCPSCSTVTPTAVIYFPLTSFNSGNTIDSNHTSNGAGQHAFVELATNDGNTDYDALELSLQRQMDHRLMYNFSYTWSHNLGDFVDNLTGGDTPQDAHNYAHEMSNSFQDVRHRFVANGTYKLPIGQGGIVMNNSSLASRLIGNWQANAIVTLQTGEPFNVTATNVSDTGGNSAFYANCLSNPFVGASKDRHAYVIGGSSFFINPAAFSAPTSPGQYGSCRPRMFHGPGLEDEDISLFKQFPVTEGTKIEARFEFFNAFNHPSFGNPAANASTSGSNFGKVSSTTVGPRIIQLAIKYYF